MPDAAPEVSPAKPGTSGSLPTSEQTTLVEDPNPRGLKKRRLSKDESSGEDDGGDGIDFEAAAARAMARSESASHSTPDRTTAIQSELEHQTQPTRVFTAPPPPVTHQTRIDQLPALDGLATQVLATLATLSHTEIGEMLFGPLLQKRQEYQSLKTKFDQAKGIYLISSPFISPQALQIQELNQVHIINKANMATFMASIFSGEIGLRIMDMNFLDVFVPENGRLLKAQGSIYLELKTQALIAAKRTAPTFLPHVMLELFPADVEKHLLARRPGAKSLAPSEVDFLKRLTSRRDILYADMRNNRLDNLESRYRWDDFSREVYSYLTRYFGQFSSQNKDKMDPAGQSPLRLPTQQDQMEGQFPITHGQAESSTTINPGIDAPQDADIDFDLDRFISNAARSAEIGMRNSGTASPYNQIQSQHPTAQSQQSSSLLLPTSSTQPSVGLHPTSIAGPTVQSVEESAGSLQTDFQQYQPVNTDTASARGEAKSTETEGEVPHKSQTAPTQVLYERARQVTTNKALPSSRKPNPPSHRRPWTAEEENALMTGLDGVKGPHWSQILAMYGPGGTVNESLKDRNQVQLKDKARNLKLFFLKAGIEVPYYLQAVTGDLKTRAPGQVEKREAKKRTHAETEGDESGVHQDEPPSDLIDESEETTESAALQEDDSDPVATVQRAADVEDEENDGYDSEMEAMLARAAASAARFSGHAWS